jgi:hypothetical protein
MAWLYTGPLGHLFAGVLDWVVLLTRHASRRRIGVRRGAAG